MTKHCYLRLAALLLIVTGCEEYEYRFEMEPCDQGIERKLTCPRNLPAEKKASIAKLYEKQIDPNTFWGRFDTNLPNDVGGAGFYSTFSTSMGRAALYSERFGGDDNLSDTLEKVQMVADRSVDFLIGWLEHELGDDPNFAGLKALCDTNVRRDARNIAIYFWLGNILLEYNTAGLEDVAARMKHYVIERGYLSSEQMHSLAATPGVGGDQILPLILKWVEDRMDYSSPQIAAERLEFLSDSKRAEESMQRYVHSTDYFAKAWEAKKTRENDPNAKPPRIDAEELVMHDIDLDFDLISWSDKKVEVKLACKSEPFDTNGQWDQRANHVLWRNKIAGDTKLPTFFYASWSEPDRAFQQERFGRVVLSDEDLAQYCTWRENLDEGKGGEWDSFVLSLHPGEDLEERLNTFRFSGDQEKGPDAKASDLARKPRELILAGLKSDEDKKDDVNTKADQE